MIEKSLYVLFFTSLISSCQAPIERQSLVQKEVKTSTSPDLKVSVIRVIDGDTFIADVYLPLSITLEDQRIRCLGYDAVELSDPKGPKAKQELESLLKDSEVFIIVGERQRDNFGRVLAETYCKKQDEVISIKIWMTEHKFIKEQP